MTFYHQQLLKITEEVCPEQYMVDRIIAAKDYIVQNYAEQIDLHRLSVEAHISRFHLLRLFKSLYGITPYQFITELRMATAKRLLKEGNSFSEVCFMVGFESIPAFSAKFKKLTGKSAREYKKQF